jgi:hypothetical protein
MSIKKIWQWIIVYIYNYRILDINALIIIKDIPSIISISTINFFGYVFGIYSKYWFRYFDLFFTRVISQPIHNLLCGKRSPNQVQSNVKKSKWFNVEMDGGDINMRNFPPFYVEKSLILHHFSTNSRNSFWIRSP